MFNYIAKKIVGTKNQRELKRMNPVAARINEREGWARSLSDEKIREELGYAPRVDFADGLARTVQWYRDNEPWWRPLKQADGP